MKEKFETLFNLAKKIQKQFPQFYLSGGTAVMFKYNHRISYDLDFFSGRVFSFNLLSSKVRKLFEVESFEKLGDNIDFFIKGIKVSFVYFPFKNVETLQKFNGLTMASDYDIFLNKIYAAGRRIEPKDPYDAAYLYKIHKWDKGIIKKDFEKKFPNQSYEIYLGALLNFDDYQKIPKWVKETLLGLL